MYVSFFNFFVIPRFVFILLSSIKIHLVKKKSIINQHTSNHSFHDDAIISDNILRVTNLLIIYVILCSALHNIKKRFIDLNEKAIC